MFVCSLYPTVTDFNYDISLVLFFDLVQVPVNYLAYDVPRKQGDFCKDSIWASCVVCVSSNFFEQCIHCECAMSVNFVEKRDLCVEMFRI